MLEKIAGTITREALESVRSEAVVALIIAALTVGGITAVLALMKPEDLIELAADIAAE
jgi:hypothetical protein